MVAALFEGWLERTATHVLTSLCSRFLGEIKNAYTKNPDLQNLLLDDFFKSAVLECQVLAQELLLSQADNNEQDSWRKVVAFAVRNGIPVPTFSTSLSFYDGYRFEC